MRNKFKVPSEFIVGYSYCLLEAATIVFNGCTVDQYNDICLEYLIGKNSSLPYVFIRVDNVELLKTVNRWNCLQNQSTKKFVLCSLIYLSSLKDLHAFEETVFDKFILFASKFESSFTERCRLKLLSKISTTSVKEHYELHLNHISDRNAQHIFSSMLLKNTLDNERTKNSVSYYINNLKIKPCNVISSDQDARIEHKSYFCTDLLKNLINIFLDFPLWTALIQDCTDEITVSLTKNSSQYLLYLEETFKEPVTASEFIKQQCELLKLSCSDSRQLINENRAINRNKKLKKILIIVL